MKIIFFVDVSCVKKAQTVNAIPKLNKLTNVTANSNISGSTSSPCCKRARCKRNADGCTEQTPTNKNNKPKRYSASSGKILFFFKF